MQIDPPPQPQPAGRRSAPRLAPSPLMPAPAVRGAPPGLVVPTPPAPAALRAVRTAVAAGLDVRLVGTLPLPPGPVGHRSGRRDWALCDLTDDPLVQARDLPVPAAQLAQLRRLHRLGIRPDRVLLGHELPGGSLGLDGDGVQPLSLPQLHSAVTAPPPSAAAQQAARAADSVTAAVLAALGTAMTATATAPLRLLDGLDPVVLGAWTCPEDAGVATFVELGRWDWS